MWYTKYWLERYPKQFPISSWSVNSYSQIRQGSFWNPKQLSDTSFGYPKVFRLCYDVSPNCLWNTPQTCQINNNILESMFYFNQNFRKERCCVWEFNKCQKVFVCFSCFFFVCLFVCLVLFVCLFVCFLICFCSLGTGCIHKHFQYIVSVPLRESVASGKWNLLNYC